jgi:hypothetical protein
MREIVLNQSAPRWDSTGSGSDRVLRKATIRKHPVATAPGTVPTRRVLMQRAQAG